MTSTATARPSATTTRSTGSSRRPTTSGISREQPGPELGRRARAAKLHSAQQLGLQDLQRAQRAGFTARHAAEERRAPGQHGLRAKRARLDDVDAAAHAAVEQYGQLGSYCS